MIDFILYSLHLFILKCLQSFKKCDVDIWIESRGLNINLYLSLLLCDLRWVCLLRFMGLRDSANHSRLFFTAKKITPTHTFSNDYIKRKSVPALLKDKFIMWNRQIIEGGCNEHVWVHCCRSSQCPQMEAQCSESNGILLFDGTTKPLNEVQMPCSTCSVRLCSR